MKVLAVGAHPDDVELGCGAALLAHRARGDSVGLLVLTGGEHGPQGQSSRVSEQEIAASILGADLFWGGFEDGAVPEGRAAVAVVEDAIRATGADVVYTHSPRDSHQDHRSAAVATLAAGRLVSRILMYETPSSLGFAPTVFVDAAEHLPGKLKALRAHVSQVLKNQMVDLDAVAAQARFRGFQARLRHAEAFETERFAWDLSGAGLSGPRVDQHVSGIEYAPAAGRGR
ncbi:LmbE family N-acetylglucosaminyl deacetylase [Catenulispora sp. EB89]|uniref:PIG-L deacetylase family protein n=1 Tax=Catenulispora sp. EB89 TaxID=3156257 RepID=UPI0035134B74